MARKEKTFNERIEEYLKTLRLERERLGIHETTAIGFPSGKPSFVGKFAMFLLRATGAQIQSEYRDLSKK